MRREHHHALVKPRGLVRVAALLEAKGQSID
jgi:hypothetical protein